MRAVLLFLNIAFAAATTAKQASLWAYEHGSLHWQTSQPKLGATPEHTQQMFKVFAICILFYSLVGVLWILFLRMPKESANYPFLRIGLNCLTYSVFAITMHPVNKSLATTMQEPSLISIVQMGVSSSFFAMVSWKSFATVEKGQILTWCIVPIFFACMLVSSFYTYEYISLSMLTILRNLTPLLVLPLEIALMPEETRPTTNYQIILCMVSMLIGAILYGGVLEVSIVGVFWAIVNMVIAVTDRIIQRRLLTAECKELPSSICTILNNGLAIFPTVILAGATGEVASLASPEMTKMWTDPLCLCVLFLSGFVGMSVGYFGMEAQRDISSTSFFVLQNAGKVGVVLLGIAVFSDPIEDMVSNLGLLMSLIGSFAYGHFQMNLKTQMQAEKTKLIGSEKATA